MDEFTNEFHLFLIRLGQDPSSVSHDIEHYTKHLLQLLPHEDEEILKQYYGLFGQQVRMLDDIAERLGISADMLQNIINADLRKLAITPEWQMMKQLIKQ